MSCEWSRRNSLLLRRFSNHQRKSRRNEGKIECRKKGEGAGRGRSRVGEMEEQSLGTSLSIALSPFLPPLGGGSHNGLSLPLFGTMVLGKEV